MTRVPKSVCKWMHLMYIRHNSAYNFHQLCRMYSDDKCICNPKRGGKTLAVSANLHRQVYPLRLKYPAVHSYPGIYKKTDTSHIFLSQYERSACPFGFQEI